MTPISWLNANIAAFGKHFLLPNWQLSTSGSAELSFENGRRFVIEVVSDRLCLSLSAPPPQTFEAVCLHLSSAAPSLQTAHLIHAVLHPHTLCTVWITLLPLNEAEPFTLQTAFNALWQTADRTLPLS